MSTSFEQIREHQKEIWNKFSPGWDKWDAFTMAFLRPMGEAIIRELNLPPTAAVLDIATGTGEPGLTIARNLPRSSVVGTDLAEGMLETARARAKSAGLKNYRTQAADVCALPFPDASFDAISCRMGFMFFPDMALAAREMARVLKRGGRCATSVWMGPEGNPWITTMMATINKHAPQPPPVPGAPGMFRCAAPELIAGLFRDAGFGDVKESVVSGQVVFDSPAQYWELMMDVAAPVVAAMSKIDAATQAKIKADVFAALERPGGKVPLNYSSRIIAGTRK